MNVFESIGIPYLDRYSDMNTVLEVLSRDDEEAQLHSPIMANVPVELSD